MKKTLSLLAVTLLCSGAFAQTKLELQPNDTMHAVLERQVGQVVDLRMKSGEKIGGKVEKVGENLVLLTQLTGAEFFDGVVDIDNVAAVALRAKK